MLNVMDLFKRTIEMGAASAMTDCQFFEQEIRRWKASDGRKKQIDGQRYYMGQHDILDYKRTVIGVDGSLREVHNLPNNRIIDNQYAKMVDQKRNYLLGQPIAYQTSNKTYEAALKKVFGKGFDRMMQNLGKDSLNCGIGWVYVYYDSAGKLSFKQLKPYEVLPFWQDDGHTALDYVVRLYEVETYEGQDLRTIEKVEIYKVTGIECYELADGALIPDSESPVVPYITNADGSTVKGLNWGRIPIIGFKFNDEETPLICRVKSLQDGINRALSDFQNNMQEDSRNTILIIKNYDGENLGEFRYNLATYGAVKVKSIDGVEGGVDALQVEVNAENYQMVHKILKAALIENAMGYDAKDDRMSGSPNQMNIQSMYSDVDLDANGMETEYQASFEELLWFVNTHLANTGQGNFDGEELEVIFNRDMMMNESDIINNIRNSVGILSDETLVAQHPWVDNVQLELKRLEKESQRKADEYDDAAAGKDNGGGQYENGEAA